jgi:hypothetical protein
MLLRRSPSLVLTSAFLLPLLNPAVGTAQYTIVNVIPVELSSEVGGNAEPSIAVNPLATNQVIISSFGGGQPYFSTPDGGMTWTRFQTVPHGDTTLAWSASGTAYMARLNGPFDVQMSPPPNNPPSFSVILGSAQAGADQPWIAAAQVGGQDRIYVGYNGGSRSTVRFSTDGGATWSNEVLERSGSLGLGDAPPTRLAINGNTVYATFERRVMSVSGDYRGEVRIVREDNGGTGSSRFRDLGDLGTTIVSGVILPGPNFGQPGTTLGHERIRSSLSIAVDPNNDQKVFVGYTEVIDGKADLRIRLSTDGGVTWGDGPVFDAGTATALPSLAVTDNGVVGLLYAHLTDDGLLETHFVQSRDDFTTFTDDLLFSFPDGHLYSGNPYVGDYFGLEAVGNAFYGTFTASNNLNEVMAPFGVTFQRLTDGDPGAGTFVLKNAGGGTVGFSLDPYFFTVSTNPEPATLWLTVIGSGILWWVYRRRRTSK